MSWNSLGKVGRLLFSVVNIVECCWGGGGVKEKVAICGRAMEYNHSAWSPTSLTPQSNGNDVCNGIGIKVVGDKEEEEQWRL